MAEDPGKHGGEGGTPQDPPAKPQDPKPGEGGAPQEPGGGEGGKDPNVHKLERDVANRDKRIKELEEQLEAATGGQKTAEERIASIERQLKSMEEERDAAKADSVLAAAGCIDLDLGRAALAALDGDVDALKEAKPYLFKQAGATPPASTGGKPAGAPPKMTREQIEAVKDGRERRRLIAENHELFGF